MKLVAKMDKFLENSTKSGILVKLYLILLGILLGAHFTNFVKSNFQNFVTIIVILILFVSYYQSRKV